MPADAGMDCVKRWIPRPSFQTRLYRLGRLFQTRLYRLHPCRRASMQAGLRRNDGAFWIIFAFGILPFSPFLLYL